VLSNSSLSRTAFTHGARTPPSRNPISFSVMSQIQRRPVQLQLIYVHSDGQHTAYGQRMYWNWRRIHYNKDQTRGFYTTGSRRSRVRQVVHTTSWLTNNHASPGYPLERLRNEQKQKSWYRNTSRISHPYIPQSQYIQPYSRVPSAPISHIHPLPTHNTYSPILVSQAP